MMNKEPLAAREEGDFSLVLGGPLYQFFLRSRLAKPPIELVHRRIIAGILLTWLPPAVLTVLAGSFAGKVTVPFLFDLANVRFLISLPLLIVAEVIVHHRVRTVVRAFWDFGLIAPEDRPAFEAMISRAARLRNSVIVEVLLLLFSFTAGYWVWRTLMTFPVSTWYAVPVGGTSALTAAGYWYAFVSLPISRFLLLRWYYRLVIWYVFLWQVSRLRLRLNPLHPDRAGGLGFLDLALVAFAPVLIAQSALLAGTIGNQILYLGANLSEFTMEIAGFIGFFMFLVLLPLMFFSFQMLEAKFASSPEFGGFASRYVREFRDKWLKRGETPEESLVGTADIQSLADLANSYEVVRTMRLVPCSNNMVVRLAILVALPLLPLVLTMMPLEELIKRLFTIIV